MKTQALTTKALKISTLLLVFFGTAVLFAQAQTVVRSGDTVSITEDQVIEGDFYSAARKINVSGSVEEDMVAAGGQISINGSIGANAFLIGARIDVHGVVGDDLRIISGETIIAEPVMGDVLVIGGTVHILSTASVSGDIILFAGEATIEGSVDGDVFGTVNTLRIDAPIAGDVDVSVEQLTLGDQATVAGSVSYTSDQLVIQGLNASVAGDLVRSDPVLLGHQPTVAAAFVPGLALLFSALAWYLLSRKSLNVVVKHALVKSPRPLLLGLAVLLFTPIAGGLLLISVIGTLVGLAVLTGYVLVIVLSLVALTAVLGQLLVAAFNQPLDRVTLFSLVTGVAGVVLFMLLPIVGQFIFLVLMILTVGAIIDALISQGQE